MNSFASLIGLVHVINPIFESHRLIEECWHEKPAKRPTFREIIKRLESILHHMGHKRQWRVCFSISLSNTHWVLFVCLSDVFLLLHVVFFFSQMRPLTCFQNFEHKKKHNWDLSSHDGSSSGSHLWFFKRLKKPFFCIHSFRFSLGFPKATEFDFVYLLYTEELKKVFVYTKTAFFLF